MPQVTSHLRARYGKLDYVCERCAENIRVGQRYYVWRTYGASIRHQHETCGYPRPSQLHVGVMTPVLAQQEASLDLIQGWERAPVGRDEERVPCHVKQLLSDLMDAAQSAVDRYRAAIGSSHQMRNAPNRRQWAAQREVLLDYLVRLGAVEGFIAEEPLAAKRWQLLRRAVQGDLLLRVPSTVARFRATGGLTEPVFTPEEVFVSTQCAVCRRRFGRGGRTQSLAIYGRNHKTRPLARLCMDPQCKATWVQRFKEARDGRGTA